jgi:ATP-dependent Clp protease ATP-binding subunit ClpC
MFERYTENALRIVFHARREAIAVASPTIETEHLLAGIIFCERELLSSEIPANVLDSVYAQATGAERRSKEPDLSADIPLSNACKRILAYAAEEAYQLGDRHIGGEHLLLAFMHEPRSKAGQILQKHKVVLKTLRQKLQKNGLPPSRGSLIQRLQRIFRRNSQTQIT